MTTTQVLTAERSLYRARLEISTRTRTIAVARSSIDTPPSSSASSSFFSRLTSTKPAHETNLISLELELKSLESMEEMLMNDLERLKKRKLMNELGRTFSGRIWLGLGWGLSIYCVWRVFIVSKSTPLLDLVY